MQDCEQQLLGGVTPNGYELSNMQILRDFDRFVSRS
jgi:hypothetical protein